MKQQTQTTQQHKLPAGWQEVELGEVCESISAGGTPRRDKNEYWDNGTIPWLKISDLKKVYISDAEEKITKEGLKNSSTKVFPKGTLIYSIFATLGAIGILEIDATTNQAIAGIIPRKDLILTKYLYYCLISEKNKIIAKKSHATQDNINLTILRNHKIPLPPLPTQKYIVQILEKAEKLKQKREEADKLTREYLQSVFYEMFGDPNATKPKYEKLNFDDCLNKDFNKKKKILQQDFLEEGEYPIIDQGEKLVGGYSNNREFIHHFNNPVIIFGDHTRILKLIDFDFAQGADGTHIFNPINKLNPYYFYYCLLLLDLPSAGYSRHLKFLKDKEIPLPPLPLQQKFAKIVEKVEKMKGKQKESKLKIDEMFNSLMQKAFKGELGA